MGFKFFLSFVYRNVAERFPRGSLKNKNFSIEKPPRKQQPVSHSIAQRSVPRKIGPKRDFKRSRRNMRGARDAKGRTIFDRARLIGESKYSASRINQVCFQRKKRENPKYKTIEIFVCPCCKIEKADRMFEIT